MSPWTKALALTLTLSVAGLAAAAEPAKAEKAEAAKSEIAKADENRKKPLQRCDELKEKAQLECLRKAREKIVEARAKREAKGDKR